MPEGLVPITLPKLGLTMETGSVSRWLRKEGETVVLSWIIWPSKEVRNAAYEKIMEDPRMQGASMPFDGQRMIYGGFEPIES